MPTAPIAVAVAEQIESMRGACEAGGALGLGAQA